MPLTVSAVRSRVGRAFSVARPHQHNLRYFQAVRSQSVVLAPPPILNADVMGFAVQRFILIRTEAILERKLRDQSSRVARIRN